MRSLGRPQGATWRRPHLLSSRTWKARTPRPRRLFSTPDEWKDFPTSSDPRNTNSSGERELDLDDLLAQGRRESENFVFGLDPFDDEDQAEEDVADWIDARFETNIKPITDEEKGALREKGKQLAKDATPRVDEVKFETPYDRPGFNIKALDLHDKLVAGSMLVIDVRRRDEYQKFRIKAFPWQCVNIPFSEFSTWHRSGQLRKYKRFKVALICNTGKVSSQATVRLTKVYGFDEENVQNLEGGISQWILSGFGLEQDLPPNTPPG